MHQKLKTHVATRRESDSKPRDTRHIIERENLEDERREMQIFDEEKKWR